MAERITCTVDGVGYLFKEINHKDAARCLGCVTRIGDRSGLCMELPDCMGGVWVRDEDGDTEVEIERA
jgi:hypothetical protein